MEKTTVPTPVIYPIKEIGHFMSEIQKHNLNIALLKHDAENLMTILYLYDKKATKYLCFAIDH